MNLQEEILKEHSKQQTVTIANWVGFDKRKFKALLKIFLEGDYRITQRSAWIVMQCVSNYPQLARPYLSELLDKLQEETIHDGVKRHVLKIFETIDIPPSYFGELVSLCFSILANKHEAVASRVYAMSILMKICLREPDIKYELQALIENNFAEEKPAFKSRGKKILSLLKKMR